MTADARGVMAQYASRSANERFERALASRGIVGWLIPFLCECADPDCLGRVEMTIAEYTEIHHDRMVFVIMPGHPLVDGELATDTRPRFDIVTKSDTL
jgi:hypothetical protein